MLKRCCCIYALHKAYIEREVPVFIIDGAVESPSPFRISVPNNAIVWAAICVINVFPVTGLQTMLCSFGSFLIAVSTNTCHSPERANRFTYAQYIGLTKKVWTREYISIAFIE